MFTSSLALLALAIASCGASARAAAGCPVEIPPASRREGGGREEVAAPECGDAPACSASTDVGSFLLQGSAERVRPRRAPEQHAAAAALTAPPAADGGSGSAEELAPRTLEKPFWLHIPKAGSGFETVLAHYVCGNAIPAGVTVMQPNSFFHAFGWQCPKSRFGRFENLHAPIYDSTPLHTVVTMMREPRGRMLSGYEYGLVACHEMQARYHCDHTNQFIPCTGDALVQGNWVRNASVIDPVEYATCWENCTVNLLMGRRCAERVDWGERGMEAAVRRVEELGFVGLTDEWNMSVCLFHAKFGGPMLASEFYNVRPGVAERVGDDPVAHALMSQAEDMLKSWPATQEMRVYEAASARFWREVDRYNVDRESCQKRIDEAYRKYPSISEPVGHPPRLLPGAEGPDVL